MTPRQFLLMSAALLLSTAIGIDVLLGGAGDPFDQIGSATAWVIGLGVAMGFAMACAVVHRLAIGCVSLALGWAMGRGGVEAIRLLGYLLVCWIGVMLMVAVTWAWLGHGQPWREAPGKWMFSAGDVPAPNEQDRTK